MDITHVVQNIIIVMVIFAGLLACLNASPPKSAKRFFNLMLKTDEHKVLVLKKFPKALAPMEHLYQGTIFATDKDTLQLICSYPNLNDEVNRFPFYFMKDNHCNYWTMFQEQGKYVIYRENPDVAKDWFKDMQERLILNNKKIKEEEDVPSYSSVD